MKNIFIVGLFIFFPHTGVTQINKKNLIDKKFRPILVAVIDTGTDIYHKDLKDFIWTNPGESGLDRFGNNKETNNIDDDGNGYVDDLHGWNFVNNNNDVTDDVGHGTHVSGIIKREFNQHAIEKKMKDLIIPKISLMILKYYNPKGKNQDNLYNSTQAIIYANKMQAQVINYSGGGGQSSASEMKAIKQSLLQKIIFVAAAGNNFSNTDIKKYYPANYELENIISVAATNRNGELLPFSNYGKQSIDIAAPGKWILSTLPNNQYGVLSGTSQATAYVSGVVAKLLFKNSNHTEKIYQHLMSEAKFNKTLIGKTRNQLAIISDAK